LVAALSLIALGTGCVTVAEHRKLERAVIDLQRSGGSQQDREQLADLGAEVEAVSARLRELNGQVEKLQRTADDALREARKARREAAAAGGAGRGSAASSAGSTAASSAPSAGASATAVSSRAASTAGSAAASSASGASGGAPAGVGGRTGGTSFAEIVPGAGSEPDEGGSPDEIRAYQAGLTAWRNSDYASCIDRFRGFLQTYASSKRADDAAFWIGDCHYRLGEFKQAVLRFDDVSRNYPTGNRAPDAVYRQGEALLKLGPAYYTAARKAFERVVKEYPDSARAEEARKQLRLRAGG